MSGITVVLSFPPPTDVGRQVIRVGDRDADAAVMV